MSRSASLRISVGVALAAWTCPCVAQDDIAQLVAQLADPTRCPRATELLVELGEPCVTPLIRLLQRCGTTDEPPVGQQIAALTVLRELGPRAVAAAAAIEHAYRYASDNDVGGAAADAIGELTPALSGAQWRRLLDTLHTSFGTRVDQVTQQVAILRLRLGDQPDEMTLDEHLQVGGNYGIAAARAAAALPELPHYLRHRLSDLLARGLQRHSLPWLGNPADVSPTGDAARALLHHGTPARDIARGLLQCRQPRLRRLGLENLGDINSWAPAERFDVVRLMWDPDRATQELAIATLTSMGADGLMALRPLRAFEAWERGQGRGKRADYFARGATRLVAAAAAARGEVAGELMRRVDLLLQGRELPTELSPLLCDAAGRELLADVVRGCLGADDETPRRLATLARATGALPLRDGDDPLRDAFLSLLCVAAPSARLATFRALVAIGPGLTDSAPERFAQMLLESSDSVLPALSSAEAMTIAGPAASDAELHQALGSQRWHVASRAIVELMSRGTLNADDRARLRSLLTTEDGITYLNSSPQFGAATRLGQRFQTTTIAHREVRALAALGLTVLGDRPWADPLIADALMYALDCEAGEVEPMLLTVRAEQGLATLAARIEQACWASYGWDRYDSPMPR